MAFEDLLLPDATQVVGEFFPWTVGERLRIPLVIVDTDGSTMRLSPGFTAAMTLNLANGADVAKFTETLTNGRIIDLANPDAGSSLTIRSTAAGLAAAAPYVGRSLVFNLLLTRTADSFPVAVMRQCFIAVKPAND